MGAQRAGAPVISGSVPPLAAYFHPRQETGFGLADGLRPGETTLLVPAQPGEGGTGKTQLAVGFAHAIWAARAVDLLVWVPAGDRAAIVAGYAQAAADLEPLTGDEAGAGVGTADSAARRFLDWLGGTGRRWAVVLDGVRSPADLDGLWPRGPAGQVVVTSQLGGTRPRGSRRRDRAPGDRLQQAGIAHLPERPAHRLPRPADRGARPRRGRRRPADRTGPGGGGDRGDREHLP